MRNYPTQNVNSAKLEKLCSRLTCSKVNFLVSSTFAYMISIILKCNFNSNISNSSSCSVTKSCQTLCNLWTIACQAPLSMGFSRQEYWSGLPFPPPGDLSHPEIEPVSPPLAGRFFTTRAIWEVPTCLWTSSQSPFPPLGTHPTDLVPMCTNTRVNAQSLRGYTNVSLLSCLSSLARPPAALRVFSAFAE